MQLPEKADFNWQAVLQKALSENVININELVCENSEIAAELKNADVLYEYWDKARYTLLPDNISPELFWAVIKFRRSCLYAEKIKLSGGTFKYLINPEILKKLYFIEKFNMTLSLSMDEENEISSDSAMEEAVASSRLEGAEISRDEAKELLRTGSEGKNENEKAVINNYRALLFGDKNIDTQLDIEFIKQLYSIISGGEKNDIFRKDEENVKVVDIRDDAILYEPPKSCETQNLLNALCGYFNADTETNPLIKAAVIHFLFAYIHPFRCANGKIARILSRMYILKSGLKAFKCLSPSKILRAIPSQYAKAFLYAEIDENDLTYFINFHLDVFIEAVNSFKENKDKEKLFSDENIFTGGKYKLNLRHLSILSEFVKEKNIRNIEYFKNKLGVVYETARKDLMFLSKKGLLTKTKKGKEFFYSLSKKSIKKLEQEKENIQ